MTEREAIEQLKVNTELWRRMVDATVQYHQTGSAADFEKAENATETLRQAESILYAEVVAGIKPNLGREFI
jgi:hypothetical protein